MWRSAPHQPPTVASAAFPGACSHPSGHPGLSLLLSYSGKCEGDSVELLQGQVVSKKTLPSAPPPPRASACSRQVPRSCSGQGLFVPRAALWHSLPGRRGEGGAGSPPAGAQAGAEARWRVPLPPTRPHAVPDFLIPQLGARSRPGPVPSSPSGAWLVTQQSPGSCPGRPAPRQARQHRAVWEGCLDAHGTARAPSRGGAAVAPRTPGAARAPAPAAPGPPALSGHAPDHTQERHPLCSREGTAHAGTPRPSHHAPLLAPCSTPLSPGPGRGRERPRGHRHRGVGTQTPTWPPTTEPSAQALDHSPRHTAGPVLRGVSLTGCHCTWSPQPTWPQQLSGWSLGPSAAPRLSSLKPAGPTPDTLVPGCPCCWLRWITQACARGCGGAGPLGAPLRVRQGQSLPPGVLSGEPPFRKGVRPAYLRVLEGAPRSWTPVHQAAGEPAGGGKRREGGLCTS